METIGEILKTMTQNRGSSECLSNLSPKEKAQILCDAMNDAQGDMDKADGYSCPICKNKGQVFFLVENTNNGRTFFTETSRDCKCIKTRRSIRRMKRSGLEATISKCTFDKYEASEEWQKVIKTKALDFVKNVDNLVDKWFFIGGSIGCGKTHICTAMTREFLLQGREAIYMLWIDESNKLKSVVNDAEKYASLIEPLKSAEVLYIDDFLKVVRGTNGDEIKPTAADIKLAYEILNYRYQQPDLITIISSERHVSEIDDIDSAVGSRIYEKTKQNACNVAKSKERNYRTKGMRLI